MFHFAFDELRSHRKQKIDQFGEEGTKLCPVCSKYKNNALTKGEVIWPNI